MSNLTLKENLGLTMFESASVFLPKIITAPIDRIKLLMQLQGGFLPKESFPRYKSAIGTFLKIRSETGFLSLWRGSLCNILTHYPSSLASIGLVYMFQQSSISDSKNFSESRRSISFYMSFGLLLYLPLVASYPLEVVYTHRATNISVKGNSLSIFSMIRELWSKAGIIGMFSGYLSHAIWHLTYNPLKAFLYINYPGNIRSKDLTTSQQLWYGHSLILGAGLLIYPFDTISRRLMIQIGKENPLGTFELIWHIFTNEGFIRGFYRGFFCSVPSLFLQSIILLGYDSLKNSL